jgi:hypothetical protein
LGYGSAPDLGFLANSGTVRVLEKQRDPARVYLDDPNSWLYREPEVSEEDRAKLSQLQSELLMPLSTRNKLLGFISLGPKLSDEPYSGTDVRLLKSVAAQTGLALENARLMSAIADEVAHRERLNREVEIAREVQERLFPQTLPPIVGIEYSGAWPYRSWCWRRLLRLSRSSRRQAGRGPWRRLRQRHRRRSHHGQPPGFLARGRHARRQRYRRTHHSRQPDALQLFHRRPLRHALLCAVRSRHAPPQLRECRSLSSDIAQERRETAVWNVSIRQAEPSWVY